MHVFVSEDHMLDWHSCQICYPLEIKLLLLLYIIIFDDPQYDLTRMADKADGPVVPAQL